MLPYEEIITAIAVKFNHQMDVIMTIEWIAFGLSMLAMAILILQQWRRSRNG